MARVLVYNPHSARNPRKKNALSFEQAEKRQAKAVRFLRDIADDPDLADEIEDLSVQEYAERKGFEVTTNPTRKRETPMKKQELQEAVKNGVAEALKGLRSNPGTSGQSSPAPKSRKQILDAVDDAAAALAEEDVDEALEILNGLLDEDNEN